MKAWILGWLMAGVGMAADWPQWLGPDRDGTWDEQGVAAAFPEDGPKVAWRVPVGLGYSGPSVANGKVYLMDFRLADGKVINDPGKAVLLKGSERVRCFDAKTGDQLWMHEDKRLYELSYPAGPRSTVTVSGGKAYALGAMGQLLCLNAESGDLIWEKDLVKLYKPKFPIWGYSAHPLVHDGMVVTMAGGEGSSVVAVDAATGEEKWKALSSEEPGYCPPTVIEYAGVEQMIVFTPLEVAALKPASGEVLWTQPLKPNYNMSIAAPQFWDGKLYASGIGRIGALYELSKDKPGAKRLWKGKPKTGLYSSNATPVIVDGTMYGADIDTSKLTAVDLKDGKRLWTTTEPVTGEAGSRVRHGTVFVTHHEPSGRFYLFNEQGELIIAKMTPEGYEELSKAKVLETTNEAFGREVVWTAPAFAMKSAFVRNDKELVRVDLAASGGVLSEK
ncbi:MAG: PQQ-binding-like beta-propeller repeat protein [Verrucomicrobiota bacterium]